MNNFNMNIFNPSITHDSRVYFKAPNGSGYQYKIYNPNNQTTSLPNNLSQYYEKGTQSYYQHLKDLNSSVYQRDNIIGKTVYTEHGRPILIKKESKVKYPQVKYESEVPVKLNWAHCDYYDIDRKYMNKQMNDNLKKINIPFEKDIKPEYKTQKTTNFDENLITMSVENINNIKKASDVYSQPNLYNKMFYQNSLNANTNVNTKSTIQNSINRDETSTNPIEYSQNTTEKFMTNIDSKNQYESYNDSDILYKEMIRAQAKAISFYLNNNPKYAKWKKNWKILDKNLNKSNLLVERLPENDQDIAYTKNKGDVIKFRWRDNDKFISKNVFMYVVLHELTHQVFPHNFIGHDEPFPTMLCIMSVAGLELNLFDLSKIPNTTVYTNGQPIGSKQSLKNELFTGISILEKENPNSKNYYDKLRQFIYLQ